MNCIPLPCNIHVWWINHNESYLMEIMTPTMPLNWNTRGNHWQFLLRLLKSTESSTSLSSALHSTFIKCCSFYVYFLRQFACKCQDNTKENSAPIMIIGCIIGANYKIWVCVLFLFDFSSVNFVHSFTISVLFFWNSRITNGFFGLYYQKSSEMFVFNRSLFYSPIHRFFQKITYIIGVMHEYS